jgi:hypothetical protein
MERSLGPIKDWDRNWKKRAKADRIICLRQAIADCRQDVEVCFFFFCGLPLDVVPDGTGGFVPFTNSRVMLDGSLRPYDPAIDGLPPDGHGVAAFFTPPPMPEPPPEHYYDPPPRRPSSARPFHWRNPNPSPEALPDTLDWKEPQ